MTTPTCIIWENKMVLHHLTLLKNFKKITTASFLIDKCGHAAKDGTPPEEFNEILISGSKNVSSKTHSL
jgi:hypothetical protein